MIASNSNEILLSTQNWVERFVIGLNLCPFAGKPAKEKLIRYSLSEEGEAEGMYQFFLSELADLIDEGPDAVETSLLVYPNGPADFEAFWDFAGLCEEAVDEAGLTGSIQVVSFHPQYRFEGEAEDAPSTFTNRSPYPMLHLLREESVAAAIQGHPDVDAIPRRNVALLEEMGLEKIRKVIEG